MSSVRFRSQWKAGNRDDRRDEVQRKWRLIYLRSVEASEICESLSGMFDDNIQLLGFIGQNFAEKHSRFG